MRTAYATLYVEKRVSIREAWRISDPMRSRKRILPLMAVLLAVAFWRLDRPAKADGELETARYKRVPGIVRELLDRGGASFSESEQSTLREATQQIQTGFTGASVDLPQTDR